MNDRIIETEECSYSVDDCDDVNDEQIILELEEKGAHFLQVDVEFRL